MANHVVILGAGYGGIAAALETRRLLIGDAAEITLINRYPYHQIVTELHQPAAGTVSEKHVRLPLDKLLSGKKINVCLGEVSDIELEKHRVTLTDGSHFPYDILVIGLGSETEYFGIPGLKEHSLILKSIDDALRIKNHVQDCLATYKTSGDESYLTFAVGGAGLTGVELIGELADSLPKLCDAANVPFNKVQLYSIEAMPSILPGFSPSLVERARTSLEARGVQFLTGVPLVQYEPGAAQLKDGRVIQTRTLIWTGGVRGHSVVAKSGLEVDGRGRALVNANLQAVGHDHVLLAGDSALVMGPEGRPYPPTAQLAGQMGTHCGRQIYALLKGGKLEPFEPHFAGTLASLGRKDAIGLLGSRKLQVKGKPASLLKDASQVRYLFDIGGLFARA